MRGLGSYYAGNYDLALMEFMKAQDLDPDSEKPTYYMAECFIKTGELEHALIELRTLIVRFPESRLRDAAISLRKVLCEAASRPASRPADDGVRTRKNP